MYFVRNSKTGDIEFLGRDAGTVIQSAINALPNGGKVFLKSATYVVTSTIMLNSNIELAGEKGAVIRVANGANISALRTASGANKIVLRGFEVDGNKAYNSYVSGIHVAVYIADASDVLIEDLHVHDGPDGVSVVNSHDVVVKGCVIENNQFNGMFIGNPNSYNVLVEGNIIRNNAWQGVELGGSGTNIPHDVIIADNHIVDNGQFGIPIWNGYNVIIKGNNILRCGFSGILVESGEVNGRVGDVQIVDNYVEDWRGDNGGIYVHKVQTVIEKVLIANNRVRGITKSLGINVAGDAYYVNIVGNIVHVPAGADAIRADWVYSSIIEGNEVLVGNNGIYCRGADNAIVGNNCLNQGNCGVVAASVRSIIVGNVVRGAGQHGIYIYAADECVVVGNQIYDCSRSTANTYYGILLDSAHYTNVVGNRISGANHKYNIVEEGTSDYNNFIGNYLGSYATGQVWLIGANRLFKQNVGCDTENFKATGVSVSVGTGGVYGSASAITSPSGRITYPRVKISWGGTFGTGETVTVKVEAVYSDGSTAYVEKSATAVGSLWLTDDDVLALVTQLKDIVKLNFYAKSSAASTAVTVTVNSYGKA
jgi:parallel beta-helix repeat protein